MEILAIKQGHPLWDQTMAFAETCSWKAGAFLAARMKKNDFKDWERVIVAVEGNRIAGYCTLAEKDELPDGYEFTPFIGFVFVSEQDRGHRVSEKMAACAWGNRDCTRNTVFKNWEIIRPSMGQRISCFPGNCKAMRKKRLTDERDRHRGRK